MSCCLSSSRLKTISRCGLYSSSSMAAHFLPNDPVPPVIRMFLFCRSNIFSLPRSTRTSFRQVAGLRVLFLEPPHVFPNLFARQKRRHVFQRARLERAVRTPESRGLRSHQLRGRHAYFADCRTVGR